MKQTTITNRGYQNSDFEKATGIGLSKYTLKEEGIRAWQYIEGKLSEPEQNYNSFTVEHINDFFSDFREKKIIVSEIISEFGLPDEFDFYRGSTREYTSQYITMDWYLIDEVTGLKDKAISIHWPAIAKDEDFSSQGIFKISGDAVDSIDVYYELMIGKETGNFIGAHYTGEESDLADAKHN